MWLIILKKPFTHKIAVVALSLGLMTSAVAVDFATTEYLAK